MLWSELQLLRRYRLSPNCEPGLSHCGEREWTYQRCPTGDAIRLSIRIRGSSSPLLEPMSGVEESKLKLTCYFDSG